jgi:hypothetical protein
MVKIKKLNSLNWFLLEVLRTKTDSNGNRSRLFTLNKPIDSANMPRITRDSNISMEGLLILVKVDQRMNRKCGRTTVKLVILHNMKDLVTEDTAEAVLAEKGQISLIEIMKGFLTSNLTSLTSSKAQTVEVVGEMVSKALPPRTVLMVEELDARVMHNSKLTLQSKETHMEIGDLREALATNLVTAISINLEVSTERTTTKS